MLAINLVFTWWTAQPASAEDECRIDQGCEVKMESFNFGGKWYWELGAELAGIGRVGTGSVRQTDTMAKAHGELVYDGASCKWIALAGDVGVYRDVTGRGFTGRQSLTFCLPYPLFRPELTLTLEQDLRPSLSAAPIVRANRLRTAGTYMSVHALHLSSRTDKLDRHVRLFVMGGGAGYALQDVDGEEARASSLEGRMSAVEGVEYGNGFLGEDRHMAILKVEIEAREDENASDPDGGLNASAIRLVLYELSSGHLPRSRHFFDISLGMAFGQLSNADDPDQTLLAVHPHLILDFYGGSAAQAAGFGYRHTVQPTNYSALVAEDRISGWWRRGFQHQATTVRGFAAMTHIIDNSGESERTFTGGVALDHELLLYKYINIKLGAEFARSFYANMHGGAAIDIGWVAQASMRASFFKSSADSAQRSRE